MVTLMLIFFTDPPGPARIRYTPSKVVKGGSVNLTCTVESIGRPNNVSYIWYRGSHVLSNVTQSVYSITSAGLETRNNFSCRAVNEGGKGEDATVFVNVYGKYLFYILYIIIHSFYFFKLPSKQYFIINI